MLWACAKLRPDAPDPLADREPRGRGEHADRPDERAPRCEDEADRDDDHALGAAADADVPTQSERLRAGARVADEEGAGDGGEREPDADEIVMAGEDECDRAQDDPLADAVGRRVEEGAAGRSLPARPRERAVEDVGDPAADQDARAEPGEEDRVAVLGEDK